MAHYVTDELCHYGYVTDVMSQCHRQQNVQHEQNYFLFVTCTMHNQGKYLLNILFLLHIYGASFRRFQTFLSLKIHLILIADSDPLLEVIGTLHCFASLYL